jgi:ATP-dependent RNA helicase DeaD
MSTTFNDLPLNPLVHKKAQELGFSMPTEIQRQVIPLLLSKDKIDVHGQAQTGTGKTLAFGLPLLHRADVSLRAPQALVVAPTRELAVQITESLLPFARELGINILTIYGGHSIEDQMRSLSRGVHIIVGTPGRIKDHMRRRTLLLDKIKTLVLDEADVMLDMGFKEEVEEIILATPTNRELWLFSATVKSTMRDLMDRYMKQTVVVSVSKQQMTMNLTKQYYCVIPSRARIPALCRLIEASPEFYGFIFCQTKLLTAEVAEKMVRRGYKVGALHGDMSQSQRNAVIKKFRAHDLDMVVATDVAARGIDIPDLTHVINLSLPEDLESYVHRIGRTGRAGKEGTAITLITKNDMSQVRSLERNFRLTIAAMPLPSKEDIMVKRIMQAENYIAGINEATINQKLIDLIHRMPEAQARTLAAHLLQDQFLKKVDEEDIADVGHVADSPSQDGLQEIMLSVGSDDGVTNRSIADMMLETGAVKNEQIMRLRVIKRRTFIKVPVDVALSLVKALRPLSIAGHQLRPVLVHDDGSFQQRRSHRRPSRHSW